MESNGDTATLLRQRPDEDVVYVDYTDESMVQDIQNLVSKDLSEPYSIFTYRYFLHTWPSLCICAYINGEMIGTIVCKAEPERDCPMRGYIAMLAVSKEHRKKGIGLKVSPH
jgi:N-alpha-acetyltransferase 30